MHKADSLPPSCAIVTKSGNLNFLEPSGSVQVCNGTALPLFYYNNKQYIKRHDKVCAQLQFNICKEIGVKLDNESWYDYVHSDQQKSIGLKFSKSRTGSHVTYSCHHNLNLLLSPYLCIRGISLSSIHYNQSHRVYINRKQK